MHQASTTDLIFALLLATCQLMSIVGLSGASASECTSALYYYAVLSTELICPNECIDENFQCTSNITDKVCHDGTDLNFYCDPYVEVDRAADYMDSDRKGYAVPWYMKADVDPAYYSKHPLREGVQDFYLVDDTNVGTTKCGILYVKVKDYNQDLTDPIIELHTRLENFHFITPFWRETSLPKGPLRPEKPLTSFSRLYSTTVQCPGTDEVVQIKVTFAVVYLKLKLANESSTSFNTNFIAVNTEIINEENIKKSALTELRSLLGSNAPGSIKLGVHSRMCYRLVKKSTDFFHSDEGYAC